MKTPLFITLMFSVSLAAGAAVNEADLATFKALDSNNDGSVEMPEIVAAAEKSFKEMDIDGDGLVTDKDHPESARKPKPGAVHPNDVNADGSISRLENLHAILVQAMACDANGDGRVSQKEWLDCHAAMNTVLEAEALRAASRAKAGARPRK